MNLVRVCDRTSFFDEESGNLNPAGARTLTHEMGHVVSIAIYLKPIISVSRLHATAS